MGRPSSQRPRSPAGEAKDHGPIAVSDLAGRRAVALWNGLELSNSGRSRPGAFGSRPATFISLSALGMRARLLLMEVERPRRVEVRPFPSDRRLVTASLRAGRRMVPMYALAEVDVTKARKILVSLDPPSSLTAFVIASVARAAAAHPEVHAYRNWRGQLVMHQHVDVTTIVEIRTAQGLFPLPHVLHDADARDVPDLSAELHSVKREPASSGLEKWFEWAAPIATHIPGALPAMYAVMARSVAVRQRIGTVAVTAVGMFAGGGGFGITPLTLMPLQVVVGGMAQRPKVVDGQVAVRDVLDLTLAIDHNVVDGAPATRFGAELRELIERAAVLSPPD